MIFDKEFISIDPKTYHNGHYWRTVVLYQDLGIVDPKGNTDVSYNSRYITKYDFYFGKCQQPKEYRVSHSTIYVDRTSGKPVFDHKDLASSSCDDRKQAKAKYKQFMGHLETADITENAGRFRYAKQTADPCHIEDHSFGWLTIDLIPQYGLQTA